MKPILYPWATDDEFTGEFDSHDVARKNINGSPMAFVFRSFGKWKFNTYTIDDQFQSEDKDFSSKEEALEACDKVLVELGWLLVSKKLESMC